MAVFKVNSSPFYQYAFMIEGHRYRGSTKSKKIMEAKALEAEMIATAKARGSSAFRLGKAPILRNFAARFLKWVVDSKLEPNSKCYYQYGWKLKAATDLAAMRLSSITKDDAETTRFNRQIEKHGKVRNAECSAQYTNQALRTLKRMLSKAEEWNLIREIPKIKLEKAYGRDSLINPATESSLIQDLSVPNKHGRTRRMREQLRDFLTIAQDSGMRPSEIFRIRIENIDFPNMRIWNPHGKTAKARRFVPMSSRMKDALLTRAGAGDRKEGWLFPSERSRTGHLMSIAKGFQALRDRMGLSATVVPYSARHTYASYAKEATGNVFAVSGAMGTLTSIHGALSASRS
jgi:integrase